jgi:hypothetical protein
MSDFDAALERLLTDPSFAAALAADPGAALAGYRLDEAESVLLRSQVVGDTSGAAATVETRTTKSSTFGLLSSLWEWTGPGSPSGPGSTAGTGATAGLAATRAADALDDLGAGGTGAMSGAREGLGDAPGGWGTGAMSGAREGFGDAPAGVDGVSRLGDAPRAGLGRPDEHGPAEQAEIAPPKGYRNRVDADGDGTWDKATYRGRTDGGVDILVDLNGDGRADFVGHDVDKDWVVDSADFDKNHDGVFEKRMYDDDGDGWLDRTVHRD